MGKKLPVVHHISSSVHRPKRFVLRCGLVRRNNFLKSLYSLLSLTKAHEFPHNRSVFWTPFLMYKLPINDPTVKNVDFSVTNLIPKFQLHPMVTKPARAYLQILSNVYAQIRTKLISPSKHLQKMIRPLKIKHRKWRIFVQSLCSIQQSTNQLEQFFYT
jgi:hypothetical protein